MAASLHRRQLGSTSLSLLPLGFGSAHLGGLGGRVSGDVAKLTLDAAWSGGIRYSTPRPTMGADSPSIASEVA